MSASAAIADPLLRRAFGRRARPSDPHRTARVRIGSSRLRAPVSRRGSAISRRIVINNEGSPHSVSAFHPGKVSMGTPFLRRIPLQAMPPRKKILNNQRIKSGQAAYTPVPLTFRKFSVMLHDYAFMVIDGWQEKLKRFTSSRLNSR